MKFISRFESKGARGVFGLVRWRRHARVLGDDASARPWVWALHDRASKVLPRCRRVAVDLPSLTRGTFLTHCILSLMRREHGDLHLGEDANNTLEGRTLCRILRPTALHELLELLGRILGYPWSEVSRTHLKYHLETDQHRGLRAVSKERT